MHPTINPLRADNWECWSRRIEAIFDEEGLTSLVNGEEAEPESELETVQLAKWKRRDGRARAIILRNVSDEQMIYIPPKNNAAQIWQHLQKYKSQPSIIDTASNIEIRHHFGYVDEWKDVEGHLMHILRTLKLKGDEQNSPLHRPINRAIHLSGESLWGVARLFASSESDLQRPPNEVIWELMGIAQQMTSLHAMRELRDSISAVLPESDGAAYCTHCQKKGHSLDNCWSTRKGRGNHAQ